MIRDKLIKFAKAPGIDLISDERAVMDMRGDPLCQDLFNEKRYRHLYMLGTNDVCSYGQFGYQINYGEGVELPVLFYAELHTFKDLDTRDWYIGVVLVYRLTEDGEPVGKPFIKKYEGSDRKIGTEAFNGLSIGKYVVKFVNRRLLDEVKEMRNDDVGKRSEGGS